MKSDDLLKASYIWEIPRNDVGDSYKGQDVPTLVSSDSDDVLYPVAHPDFIPISQLE
jgi:hypothetical protein